MIFHSRFFHELDTEQLYALLKARVDVFVVEQNCPYHELDGVDKDSLHVFYEENGEVIAYLRAFNKSPGVVQMGRVLTVRRCSGLGGRLLKDGIREIREKLKAECIYIEAQCYAAGFYEREGFAVCSEEFLEDGIPHIGMKLDM